MSDVRKELIETMKESALNHRADTILSNRKPEWTEILSVIADAILKRWPCLTTHSFVDVALDSEPVRFECINSGCGKLRKSPDA